MLYLFDIDGTLVLTGGAGTRALNRLFADRYGIAGAMDGIRPGGMTDPGIVAQIFAHHLGRAPEPLETSAILETYIPLLEAELADAPRFQILAGAVAAVEFLAAQPGPMLGLASGNVRAAARLKLERAGLWRHFAVGGFGDDAPDRAGLVAHAVAAARAATGRAFAGAEVVVVGDTPADVAAARAIGARMVAVATGSVSREGLAACAPDAVLDSLAELRGWHESHSG